MNKVRQVLNVSPRPLGTRLTRDAVKQSKSIKRKLLWILSWKLLLNGVTDHNLTSVVWLSQLIIFKLCLLSSSLRKQPTFREVATWSWALAKRRLSNERRNSILMKYTTRILVVPLIGCAARDFFFFQKRIWVVHVISMEFLRSLLRRRFARAQVATSRNVGCFLRLAELCTLHFLGNNTFLPLFAIQ